MKRLLPGFIAGYVVALAIAGVAAAHPAPPWWHHTTSEGIICNDSPTLADAGPFDTLAGCQTWKPAPKSSAPVSIPDGYQWCNDQAEAAPFVLGLAESLTHVGTHDGWYRPFMVAGKLTCATFGKTIVVGVYQSVGGETFNQAQYDAVVGYWKVAPLYQVATA